MTCCRMLMGGIVLFFVVLTVLLPKSPPRLAEEQSDSVCASEAKADSNSLPLKPSNDWR